MAWASHRGASESNGCPQAQIRDAGNFFLPPPVLARLLQCRTLLAVGPGSPEVYATTRSHELSRADGILDVLSRYEQAVHLVLIDLPRPRDRIELRYTMP